MRDDWIECMLGEVLVLTKAKHKPVLVENLFYIGLEHIEKESGRLTKTVKVDEIKTVKNKFEKGQILYGKLRPYFNKVYLASQSGVCSTDILVFQPTKIINSKFAMNYMLSRKFVNKMSANMSGVNLPRVSTNIVTSYKFPLPPLPIQKAIVAKIEELFSSLDSGIADLKKAQDQLVIYRQAVLKKAFEGELTNTSFKRIPISQIGEILTGNTPSKKQLDNYNSRDYNFYKPTDLNAGENVLRSNDFLSKVGFKNSRQVRANSILVTCIGATIGKTGLIKKEGGFNQQINAIVPFDDYNSKFIYHQATGINFQSQIKSNASSTTLPIINKGKFSKLEMNICPKQEQRQIVREIESRLSVCDKVEESITESLEKARALRQSILKKAFEGKLLSDDEIAKCKASPDYEPASVLLERIKKEKKK